MTLPDSGAARVLSERIKAVWRDVPKPSPEQIGVRFDPDGRDCLEYFAGRDVDDVDLQCPFGKHA